MKFFTGLFFGAATFFPLGIMYTVHGASNSKVVWLAAKTKSLILTILEVL
jgi:hypothetical protein